jgi:hypothetical protein
MRLEGRHGLGMGPRGSSSLIEAGRKGTTGAEYKA